MNVFLITSPFQYICACEAKAHYKTKENILVLVNQDSEPGITQQKRLVNYSEWDYVIIIGRNYRSIQVPSVIRKIKKIAQGCDIEYFFHAEYNAWRTKLILRNLDIAKEVYFDDGTLTINEYEECIRDKKVFYRSRFLQDLLVRLQGCKKIDKLEQSKNLEIFTIFDIKRPEHKIVKNELLALKGKLKNHTIYNESSPIGFIGQGAIGHKRKKTEDQYTSEIMEISKKFNRKIIYFPHRTESSSVRENIKKIPGIIYHQSSLPLELEIIDKNITLSGFIGIFSTAQYTYKLLDKNLPVYNIISETTYSLMTERTKRIHTAFKAVGIQDLTL
ncbi:glycosyltransferase 52 family protein [Vibrio vulnificus]|uniref:glycosyltransferase 52 family protein n=1 Tax=Vibrio vulnificus TaxID=672 RepID=UPI001CDBA1A6|nr:glycosyltransferase 52 family protein [Vibrio vulnificus]MCA3940595.1 glycosyltransferase 52 family protein [Vibrio vulnificus]